MSQGKNKKTSFLKIWNQASDTKVGSAKNRDFVSVELQISGVETQISIFVECRFASEICYENPSFFNKIQFFAKNILCVYGSCFLLSTGTSGWFFVGPIGCMCLVLLVNLKSAMVITWFCKAIQRSKWFCLSEICKIVQELYIFCSFLCRWHDLREIFPIPP